MSNSKPDVGTLFVLTGPSGVGKSTLIQHVRSQVSHLTFSVSATTRARRPGEKDGVDYHFLTEGEFSDRIAAGDFLEHATVYGFRYGTLRADATRAIQSGQSIILDIDLLGARQIRQSWPNSVLIFLLPPSIGVLEDRLRGRGTDEEAVIRRRMEQVSDQILGCDEFDYLVINDELARAKSNLLSVFTAHFLKREVRESWVVRAKDQARNQIRLSSSNESSNFG